MKLKTAKDNTKPKELLYKKCPSCCSKQLLKLEVDTVCLDCDWDSALADVASGNFEKRIGHEASLLENQKPIRSKTKIVFTRDIATIDDDRAMAVGE